MNNDELRNVMLNANLTTLKSLCLTNQFSNQLCHSQQFWKDKYLHYHYPVMNRDSDWETQFIEMNQLDTFLNKMFDLITNTIYEGVIIKIKYDHYNKNDILQYATKLVDTKKIGLYKNIVFKIAHFSDINTLEIYEYRGSRDYKCINIDNDLSINEIKEIMLKTLFTYPEFETTIEFD